MSEGTGRSALVVGAGAAIAAVSGILFLAISARSLTTQQNTAFLTYWAALFAVFAVLSGVQNEMTRAVRTDRDFALGRRATSPLAAGLIVGAGAAIFILLLFPLWQLVFVGPSGAILPMLLVALATLLYAGHVATVGTLAGLGRWNGFAGLTAAESLVRLALALLAALLGWGFIGFETAAAGGALTWFVLTLLMPHWRTLWTVRIDLSLPALLKRVANAMAAAGATALLVTGFPLLMSLTTDPAAYAQAAPLIVAVSITRAPLLIPVTAFQSMVIASFVAHPARAGSSLARLVAVVLAIAAAGGVLAALVGPGLMTLVFGAAYANSSLVLAMLVVAAALLALLVLGGSVALALDAHTVNTVGWYLALVISTVIMVSPADLETRTILALALGPLAGSAFHFAFVLRILHRRVKREA